MGAWSQKILGKINKDLPGNVVIGNSTGHPGPGFLEARVGPVPVGDPAAGLQNTQQPKYLQANQFDRRMKLTSSFDSAFEKKYPHKDVKAYSELYQEAIKLLKSSELKAFDINAESDKAKEQYGDSTLGKACLLARRLIEHGVRFVEVTQGGWDMHRDVFREMPTKGKSLDQALSALLADLESKKLLDSTLVVVATEFGRTPKINENTGRDHHPGAFTCLLSGGGIQGGRTHGKSDKDAQSIEDGRIGVADFNATIAYALGLPLSQEFISPSKRPFKVAAGVPGLRAFEDIDVNFVARERPKSQRCDELRGTFGHQNRDIDATILKAADNLRCFVARNSTTDAERDFHSSCCCSCCC